MSNVDETIEYAIRNYPSLFANRTQVLWHLLCVPGNGYVWHSGELVSVFEQTERTDVEVLRKDHDHIKELESLGVDMSEAHAEIDAHNLECMRRRRAAFELAREHGPLEYPHQYLDSPRGVPDDITPEWKAVLDEYLHHTIG